MVRSLIAALFVALSVTPAAADSPYELNTAREWTLIGTGAALNVTGLVMTHAVNPYTADDLATLDPAGINSFDRNGMHPYRSDHAGDALAAVSYLLPLTFLAIDDARADWQTLALMWGEATLLNIGINGIVKAGVQRTRPYAYDPGAPLDKTTSRSAKLSFYSGHTTGTAMNCFFAARVLTDYLEDRSTEIMIWTGAVTVPALVAFARVDSGHHFRTDVLTGYAVGATIGWLVPQLHRRQNDRVSLHTVPMPGGAGIGINVVF